MKRIKNLTAEQLRKSILQLAIQGKLVSQNAEDGNAKDLLAEIKKEKAKLIKAGKIKKEKPLPEITDREKPFEIPKSWCWCRLGDICKFISRGKSPKYSDIERIPVFAQKCNLKDGEISLEQSKFLDPTVMHKWKDEYKILDGDILINSTGTGTVMRTRLFKNEYLKNYLFVVPDSHITIVRTFDLIVSKFIYLFCRSFIVQKYWEENLAGSTNQKELYVSVICNTIIPLPPLAEQKRIVEKIESLEPLLKEYEKREKALTELDDNFTEKFKKSILQYATQGKLVPQDPTVEPATKLIDKIRAERAELVKLGKIKKEKNESIIFKGNDGVFYEKVGKSESVVLNDLPFEIPEGWVWIRQKNLITFISGCSYNKLDITTNGLRVVRGGNIQNYRLKLEPDDIFLPIEKYLNSNYQIRKNDILIVASTGSKEIIGKPAFVEEDYSNVAIGAFLRIIRLMFKELFSFLKLVYQSNYYFNTIRRLVKGTNINNIKSDFINEFLIPIPPLSEQKRIVAKIEQIFKELERIEKAVK